MASLYRTKNVIVHVFRFVSCQKCDFYMYRKPLNYQTLFTEDTIYTNPRIHISAASYTRVHLTKRMASTIRHGRQCQKNRDETLSNIQLPSLTTASSFGLHWNWQQRLKCDDEAPRISSKINGYTSPEFL